MKYDAKNYSLITDDPNTLSLQHFDGSCTDSSNYGRSYFSQNRSSTYVDSGAFGKAVSLPNGSAAGATIPGLSGYAAADFPYDSYRGQWVSMRITLKNNKIYYFVNGDLAGSGAFTKPTASNFY